MLSTTHTEVEKESLRVVTDDNEPNKVVRLEKVRRPDHQRSTQTNSLSHGESQDASWAGSGNATKNTPEGCFFVTLVSALQQIRTAFRAGAL
jgi:hypothetical protein